MTITAIIPTYNRADFLVKAIKSVLSQSCKVDEIIVVDDGSTDNTSEVLKQFESIKVIQTENLGVSHARNKGIKNANSNFVAFLDSDDIWLEDKIKQQIFLHVNNPKILFSHTKELWERNGKNIKYPKKLEKPNGDCFLQNIPTCKIAASSVMAKKSIFDDIGYFDENLLVCEDYDMWLRVSFKYNIGLVQNEGIKKFAGHEQLSNTIFAIDRYHISSLLKFLDTSYSAEVKKEILKKCEVLIKGAVKHNNQQIMNKYLLLRKELSDF